MNGLADRLANAFYATPYYRKRLARRAPDRVLLRPPEPWPGDARRGAAIVRGDFQSGGDVAVFDRAAWARADLSERWQNDLHGFDWLADLQAVGGDGARRAARTLALDWIEANPPARVPGWRADVLGHRIANWLVRFEFFAASAEDEIRARVLESLGAQVHHLARIAELATPPPLDAAKGLVYAGVSLPDGAPLLRQGLALLERFIGVSILADGGHVSRNPSRQLDTVRQLIDIRSALVAAEDEVPETLARAIAATTPLLRLLRHGDGRLALFGGANEEDDGLIDMVVSRSNVRGRVPSSAEASGYQRLAANRTLILIDTGRPPPPGHDTGAHAGTLAFELSVGRDRVIVNCGAYDGGDGTWSEAARATAAHSTAVIRNTNSSGLIARGGLSRRPQDVTCRREEADGAILLDASHDGYVQGFGLSHRRRLYLSAGGDDVRGEDTLAGDGWHDFELRFHLHPAVRASLVQDGSAVLLRLAGGGGWRFACEGGQPELQPSVYMGVRGRVRRSQQIVVAGSTAGGRNQVKWTLKRFAAKAGRG